MSEKNIIFIGFMGCGKSSTAKVLAKKLSFKFLDTDTLIKNKFGLEIKEIFEYFGEEFFRREEQILSYALPNFQKTVIATGGGFYKALKKNDKYVIVYLKANFELLKSRLNTNALRVRPLFNDEKKARELYSNRLKGYEQKADIIVNIKGKTKEMIVEELIKRICYEKIK